MPGFFRKERLQAHNLTQGLSHPLFQASTRFSDGTCNKTTGIIPIFLWSHSQAPSVARVDNNIAGPTSLWWFVVLENLKVIRLTKGENFIVTPLIGKLNLEYDHHPEFSPGWSRTGLWLTWKSGRPVSFRSYLHGRQIKVLQNHKYGKFSCRSRNRVKGVQQVGCCASGRSVQQQQAQLIPRAQFNFTRNSLITVTTPLTMPQNLKMPHLKPTRQISEKTTLLSEIGQPGLNNICLASSFIHNQITDQGKLITTRNSVAAADSQGHWRCCQSIRSEVKELECRTILWSVKAARSLSSP